MWLLFRIEGVCGGEGCFGRKGVCVWDPADSRLTMINEMDLDGMKSL